MDVHVEQVRLLRVQRRDDEQEQPGDVMQQAGHRGSPEKGSASSCSSGSPDGAAPGSPSTVKGENSSVARTYAFILRAITRRALACARNAESFSSTATASSGTKLHVRLR